MKRNQFFSCKGIQMMLLAVMMLFGYTADSMAYTKFAEGIYTKYYSTTIGDIKYYAKHTTNGYVAWVAGIAEGVETPKDINIPLNANCKIEGTVYTCPVVGIITGAFKDQGIIQNVYLPSSVVTIESRAFENCTNLKSISGHNRVEYIGPYAFSKCPYMESFTIYPALTHIGSRAFQDDRSLQSLSVYDNNCNLKELGEYVFTNCNFTSIPTGLNTWGSDEYENENFNENQRVTHQGAYLFANNPISGSVSIPSDIKIIPTGCFYGCPIRFITNWRNTTTVCGKAFCDTELTQLTIPAKLGCASGAFNTIKTLFMNNPVEAGAYPNHISRTYGTELTKITFSEDCTDIGERTAEGCDKLTTVVFPSGKVTIHERAFNGCPLTGTLTLNNAYIYDKAFSGAKFKEINLTGATIGAYAFANTSPSNLTITDAGEIQAYAMDGATIGACNITAGVGVDETAFNNATIETLTIDAPYVYEGTFASMKKLYAVTIGTRCGEVREGAFNGCPDLRYVTFSKGRMGQMTIETKAFANCPYLNDITLDGDFKVADYAFENSLPTADITIRGMANYSDYALAGRQWRNINILDEEPSGNCLKNATTKWITFTNATSLGGNGILEGSTVEMLYAPNLRSITQKDVGRALNLRDFGTIKNEYLYASAFTFGCVYSADRKTLVFVAPGRNEALLEETVEKIDLRGTDMMAAGDRTKRGIPIIDATAITNHKVTPINDDGTHACAKYIRIATGCRKYFAEFEKIKNFYTPTLVQDYIQGDVNDDGQVSVADVMNVYDQLK